MCCELVWFGIPVPCPVMCCLQEMQWPAQSPSQVGYGTMEPRPQLHFRVNLVMHMDRSGISNSLKTMTMERTLKWEAQPACHQHCLGSFSYWNQDRTWEQDQRSRRRRRTRLAQPKAGFGRAQCVTIVGSQKWILESDKWLDTYCILLPTLSNLDHRTPASLSQILLMTLGVLCAVSFFASLLLLSPQAPGMVPATGRQSEDGIYLYHLRTVPQIIQHAFQDILLRTHI